MVIIIIHIFYIIHNRQLSYDDSYVNLITYLHQVVKLYMLDVKWWILIFHIIFQIISQFVEEVVA
jgi:hypothetical protein